MPDIYVAKEKKAKESNKKAPSPQSEKESVVERLKAPKSANAFASLIIHPQKITFETQESKEKVVLLARQHLFTNVKWVLLVLVLLILPFFVFQFLPDFLNTARFRPLLFLFWYLATFSFAFEQFLKWFFNVNIITDERVIDIDFPSLLYRDISSTKIEMIQDISVKTGGFIRSLLNYGDVHIQTAGEQREFVFEAIPQPERVIDILNQMMEEEEKEKLEGRTR